jgi:hypothetical protein
VERHDDNCDLASHTCSGEKGGCSAPNSKAFPSSRICKCLSLARSVLYKAGSLEQHRLRLPRRLGEVSTQRNIDGSGRTSPQPLHG